MEKGGVCILSYRDILHADIFSLFMIWEEIHRCFVFLNLLMTTHTQLELTKGNENYSEKIQRVKC